MHYVILHGITGTALNGSQYDDQDAAEGAAIRMRKNHSIDIVKDDDGKRTTVSYVAEGEAYDL